MTTINPIFFYILLKLETLHKLKSHFVKKICNFLHLQMVIRFDDNDEVDDEFDNGVDDEAYFFCLNVLVPKEYYS